MIYQNIKTTINIYVRVTIRTFCAQNSAFLVFYLYVSPLISKLKTNKLRHNSPTSGTRIYLSTLAVGHQFHREQTELTQSQVQNRSI